MAIWELLISEAFASDKASGTALVRSDVDSNKVQMKTMSETALDPVEFFRLYLIDLDACSVHQATP
jgi:hypothetical protein